ncbi:MAG: cysteine synthase A [Ruminococcaceae bacterium]|nr:cysteine synthase A [Oscillospiraceae bacterium]
MIYNNITELIGGTPLLRATKICDKYNLQADVILKLEFFNPAGSVKDRAAYEMIKAALDEGKIKEGATLVEPTSGNTGIGLAMASSYFNMKTVLVMPDTMSVERRKILSAYGAEIVLTDGKEGMMGAVKKAEEIAKNTAGAFIPSQFDNPANSSAHYKTTGVEIWNDTKGEVDVFVATVGTGGTISGTGRYLKEKNPEIEVVAVEPEESPLISCGKAGSHKIQGIGANFIPENFDSSVVDKVLLSSWESAYEMVRVLAKEEGVLLGISSGAAVAVAIELAKKSEYKGKKIVVLCPDTGMRYLSTEDLF